MILPVSFVIAFVIKLFPFDVITILPSSFVIALDIDKLAVELFAIFTLPTLLIAPDIVTAPVPFWVIAKLPMLSISPNISILPPPFANKISPSRFVISLADVISPFVLYIDKSPFLLYMEPLISNPFLDDISTPRSSLVNSALIVSF